MSISACGLVAATFAAAVNVVTPTTVAQARNVAVVNAAMAFAVM